MLSQQQEGLEKIKAVLAKGILSVLIPPLLAFILVIMIIYKICRYVYKWPAYSITALRAIFEFLEESREMDNDELAEVIEVTGFSYDSEQDIFYSKMDAWQRNFGYCRLYDEASAPLGMIIDCEPIYFDYGGKQWLIELWKGQYDLTTGCEIGVYTIEGHALNIPGVFNRTFYKSVSNEDRLYMSYILKKNDEILFIRKAKHWWLTGFKLGEFSEPSELTMKIKIILKDENMRNAFIKGLNNAGYSDDKIKKYGNTVSFIFDKPNTRQPMTRTKVTDWIIQRKNKFLCAKCKEITGGCNNILDKLKAIQEKSPKMYRRIMNIGKTKYLYKKFKTINNYLN